MEWPYTVLLDYSGNNPIYEGNAVPGTAVTLAEWRIRKYTYSGNKVTKIEWAHGNANFDNVWNDRATYPYS